MKLKRSTNILATIAIVAGALGLVAGFSVITKVFREYSCLNIFIDNIAKGDLVTLLSLIIPVVIGIALFLILLIVAIHKEIGRGIYWAIVALLTCIFTAFLWGVLPTLHDQNGWFYQTYLSSRLDIPMMEYGYYASVALTVAGAVLALVAFITGLIYMTMQETPVKPEKVSKKAKKEAEAAAQEGEEKSEAEAEGESGTEGEEKPDEASEEAEAKEKAPKAIRIKLVKEDKVNSVTPVNKVYHVVKREDGKWSVRAAKSKKVLKLFDTKVEAVNYANALARRQDASVAVHASKGENKGRIQKQ